MLVLASSSPRRQELLRNARIAFVAEPAEIDESLRPGERARDYALRMAREKALAVWARHAKQALPEEMLVLGADTVVVIDGEVLGKPSDANDAAGMLRRLSGREHEVITAVCLVGRCATINLGEQNVFDLRAESTTVSFDELSEEDVCEYVASGEPMDKAGAYAIQGMASRWVHRLEGDYTNVVGLPVRLVYRMLRDHEKAPARSKPKE